jgi:glutathione S-transferase
MSEDLVFYTNPMSRGRIARWMLEEVGAPYRTEVLQYGPEMQSDAYRAVNPMAKVPAIVHRGAVVTECAAICAYLAEAFPAANLAPPMGAPERAGYWRWLFFAAGPVEAATTNSSLGVVAPPEKQGMVGYGSLERVTDVLEALAAEGPYLLGAQFTAVDVYLGSQISWGLQFGSIPSRPALAAYAQRIAERPAALRAREIDDALMKG